MRLGNGKREFPQRGACTICIGPLHSAEQGFCWQTRRGPARTQADSRAPLPRKPALRGLDPPCKKRRVPGAYVRICGQWLGSNACLQPLLCAHQSYRDSLTQSKRLKQVKTSQQPCRRVSKPHVCWFKVFLRMEFHTMKHNRDLESNRNCKLHKANFCLTFILTDLTRSSLRPKNLLDQRVEGAFRALRMCC